MASSVNITISDTGLDGTTVLKLRDTGATGNENMKVLAGYLRELEHTGTYAYTVRVSGTAPVRAVGTVTMTGIAVADETVTFGATVFTWKASAATESEVTIGGDAATSITNLIAKINAHSVASKVFLAAEAAGDTMSVTALVAGLAGNGLRFAEASSNLTMDGSGLLGATTAGAGNDDATVLRRIGPSGGTVF